LLEGKQRARAFGPLEARGQRDDSWVQMQPCSVLERLVGPRWGVPPMFSRMCGKERGYRRTPRM
jgi:hypothetical protein